MKTRHKLFISDARIMGEIKDQSIDLVVTSPPYPMIQMWDELFSSLSPNVSTSLRSNDGNAAFETMHRELDAVWRELFRILKPGSYACINIGDAARSIGDRFQLYSNHSRIINSFRAIGFDCLPVILWRKQTNAPNKFMGSGMLPAGAYVTLEHEYILIFRKGPKKEFLSESDKELRMQSAFYWEERNRWFSDVWDFKGTRQGTSHSDVRNRSGAFPLELPYRLINMYSLYEDIVLDPFMGTGTTALAALTCGRNSVGIEIDSAFAPHVINQTATFLSAANQIITSRIESHLAFIASYAEQKGAIKHANEPHGYPVITRQEKEILHYKVKNLVAANDLEVLANYEPIGKIDSSENAEREKIAILDTGSDQMSMMLES
jgi:DNA modification methylase